MDAHLEIRKMRLQKVQDESYLVNEASKNLTMTLQNEISNFTDVPYYIIDEINPRLARCTLCNSKLARVFFGQTDFIQPVDTLLQFDDTFLTLHLYSFHPEIYITDF